MTAVDLEHFRARLDDIGVGDGAAGADLAEELLTLAEQLHQRVAELEAEGVERMADRFVEESRIRSMDFRNGIHMDLEPARELVVAWVACARTMLGDAENYSETRVDLPPADKDPKVSLEVKLAGELERYAVTLQRVGKLTPHEARMRAEAEAERLRRLLSALVDDEPCWFDHHGGCQAHGFLSLKPGEPCPNAEARELLGGGR